MICLLVCPPPRAPRGKGKRLDSCALDEEAITEHYELIRKLFQCLADNHLQLREEMCHFFCQRVKYCGHILHQGRRSPAPRKMAAVSDWTEAMFRPPKQMKDFSEYVIGIPFTYLNMLLWVHP